MPENGPRAGDDARIQARRVESIMRIPVVLQVVVGSATLPVASLLKLGRGAVLPLDHRVGDPVDVVVNGRTIARGEVVVVEEDGARFGVSLTEICEPQQEQMS
ncbi:flagellar motor switch protein FliN [Methylocystis parvus]|nr:flagellar motor switch protein FliN [Methylocystis parvus]WBK02062.1 flagellar motor switch protein FliN [Methylocystis parvus OBBP]